VTALGNSELANSKVTCGAFKSHKRHEQRQRKLRCTRPELSANSEESAQWLLQVSATNSAFFVDASEAVSTAGAGVDRFAD